MKPLAYYFPGKSGDTLLQWPVARQHLNRRDGAEVWLDESSCKMLKPLFEAQPGVTEVKLLKKTENYTCGGQPWHGNFSTEEHEAHEIISLGFRAFPQRQITLQTALDFPGHIDTKDLAKPSIVVSDPIVGNRCVIHGTFQSHMSGVPKVWKLLHDIHADLESMFDECVFVGLPGERATARELYPNFGEFADDGNFLELARLMAGSRLVIGSGSCGVVLAGVLGVASIRVHDPIGDAAKVTWSNLGPNQWNETEVSLRRLWPEIKSALTPQVVEQPT